MENALNEIAKLVADYTSNQKFADQNFVDKVITILVNALGINNYVTNNNYSCENNLLGSYDFFSKTISIDMDRVYMHILSKQEEEYQNGINLLDDRILRFNLLFANLIAHEAYHALQYKKAFSDSYGLETDLFQISFEHNILLFNCLSKFRAPSEDEGSFILKLGELEENKMYLDALPSERIACIDASVVEKEVAKLVSDCKRLHDYQEIKYKLEMIRGYEYGKCPTAYIMSVHSMLRNAYNLSSGHEERLSENEAACKEVASQLGLSLNDRLYYGLYVTSDELNPITNDIVILTRKLKNNS